MSSPSRRWNVSGSGTGWITAPQKCPVASSSAWRSHARWQPVPLSFLADEPTGNLDSHSGKEVMRILHELSEEGRTVILITHDNGIAAEAKRVVRIQDGKVVDDYLNS